MTTLQSTQLSLAAAVVQQLNYTCAETFLQMQRRLIDTMTEPARRMHENLAIAIEQSNRRMIAAFIDINPRERTDTNVVDTWRTTVIEGDIIDLRPAPTQTIHTQQLQIHRMKPILQSRLGLQLFPNGSFKYKRKLLRNVSLDNDAGKLLQLFLLHNPHWVTHVEIQNKFNISADEAFANTFSHILKRLKNIFKENSLSIEIICQRKRGYTLVAVNSLN